MRDWLRMVGRLALLVAVVGTLGGSLPLQAAAPAQAAVETGVSAGPVVETDWEATKRVFVVYAFLNAGGYEDDGGHGWGEFREGVRQAIAASPDKGLLARVKAYNSLHSDVSFAALTVYALSLSGTGPYQETRGAPGPIQDFLPLLNEFYTKARISTIWEAKRAEIQAHLDEVMPILASSAQEVFDYAREPDPPSTCYIYVPNLLETYGQASLSKHGDKYYVVEGPHMSTGAYVSTFQHEMAHHVVGPIVVEQRQLVVSKRGLFQKAPGEVRIYYRDWDDFVEESLVRAVSVRIVETISPNPSAGASMRRADTRMGFFLGDQFIQQLKEYEVSELPLRDYAATIFEAMQ